MSNRNILRGIALGLALTPAFALAGQQLALLPAQAGDQVPQRLSAKSVAAKAGIERAPVAFAWALDAQAPITPQTPFVSRSREFWRQVEAADLDAGIALHTTAPGAVLRLSPLARSAKRAIDPQQLVVQHKGRTYAGERAFDQLADGAQLKAAGLDLPAHSIAVRLRKDLGAGEFRLQLPQAGADVLLHVFEPDSGEVLALGNARDNVLEGDWLDVTARFESAQGASLGEVVGTISAPNGRLFDLEFVPQTDASWHARARVDAFAGAGEGLWEVHATAVSEDGRVQRDARTAFGAVSAGAKLAGSAEVTRAKGGAIHVSLPVDVAAASRYNIAGLLYGSDAGGAMQPLAIAHAAAWIEAGQHALTLQFDAELLAQRGLSAPFELRDVALTDQSTLGLIERRARALQFDLR